MQKDWYKSKSVWGAVIVFIGGGLVAFGFQQIGEALIAIGTSLGFIGVRIAMK